MTHYEAIYGQQPSSIVSYIPSTSKVNVVDSFIQNRESTPATIG